MNYIYSIIPTLIIAIIIYNLDKHKEPIKILLKLFIGGIIATLLVLIIVLGLNYIIPEIAIIDGSLPTIKLFINILITIGITEELSKWIITYFLSYNNKEFDEIYDIIVYSVFVSLGFATLENILYVTESAYAINIAIVRGVLSIPAHTALGVIMGSFLGLAKIADINNNSYEKKQNILYSILIPIELHTIYDLCSISKNIYLTYFFYIFVILLFIFTIVIIKQFLNKNVKIK